MNDVSIEYAHIYTNSQIDLEHELSLDILDELRAELAQTEQSYKLFVMIDDYSFPDPTFDYSGFILWLTEKGHGPDLAIRESQLIPVCDIVINQLTSSVLKKKLVRYTKDKKYPCSLFIAAWYLLRLGYIESPVMSVELTANKLINILPESFKLHEDKGLEIIKNTSYKDAASRIEYRLFKGREMPEAKKLRKSADFKAGRSK